VIQRGHRARFALEALRELLRGDFDRDVAPQPRIAGAIHLTHASRADQRENFVGAEFVAGRKRHLFSKQV